MGQIYNLRNWFWGSKTEKTNDEYSSKSRKIKLQEILHQFKIGENSWRYSLDLFPLPLPPFEVCEGAYLAILGYPSVFPKVSRQWITIKNGMCSGSLKENDELRKHSRHNLSSSTL